MMATCTWTRPQSCCRTCMRRRPSGGAPGRPPTSAPCPTPPRGSHTPQVGGQAIGWGLGCSPCLCALGPPWVQCGRALQCCGLAPVCPSPADPAASCHQVLRCSGGRGLSAVQSAAPSGRVSCSSTWGWPGTPSVLPDSLLLGHLCWPASTVGAAHPVLLFGSQCVPEHSVSRVPVGLPGLPERGRVSPPVPL